MKLLIGVLLGIAIAALIFGTVFVLMQERESSPEKIAKEVARDWTSEQIDNISDAIALQVTGGIPGIQQLASGVISNQIRQHIQWEYATPIRLSQDTYEVVATASAPIEVRVLVFDKQYQVSLGFKVVVNTKDRTVERWSPDLGSFGFKET